MAQKPSANVHVQSTNDDRLDLKDDLVPAVRNWLRTGVSEASLASGARVRSYTPFSGGLKADIVAGVAVELKAVAKVGSVELMSHRILMDAVNAENVARRVRGEPTQDAIFPEVLSVGPLGAAPPRRGARRSDRGSRPERFLMLMQDLAGYRSLDGVLFEGKGRLHAMKSAVSTCFGMLDIVHSVEKCAGIDGIVLPTNPEPFLPRMQRLLEVVRAGDKALQPMWERPGLLDGAECPSIGELMDRLTKQISTRRRHPKPRLVHGDPHTANLLIRTRGRQQSVRFIDPNPVLGFSDTAYDFGKVLHFLEPVGWLRHRPENCIVDYTVMPRPGVAWQLSADLGGAPAGTEKHRRVLEEEARRAAMHRLARDGRETWILDVAVASAHLGLAVTTGLPDMTRVRRFALAVALRKLLNATASH